LHSNLHAVAADANSHRQPIPSQTAAARPATTTAVTASATGLPDGAIRTRPTSSHNAHRTRCARTFSATEANRDSQPRTVDRDTPTVAEMRRCPNPAAFNSNALPIVAAKSPRRASIDAGSSTCVIRHPRQIDRRGRTRHRCSPRPTGRGRAHPHGANRPPQEGHRSVPAASSDSTRTGSGLTVVTAALLSQQEALPVCPPRHGPGGLRLFTEPRTVPQHTHQGNPTAAPPSSPPLAHYSPTVLTSRGAQHQSLVVRCSSVSMRASLPGSNPRSPIDHRQAVDNPTSRGAGSPCDEAVQLRVVKASDAVHASLCIRSANGILEPP